MKKITFKHFLFLALAITTLQVEAQLPSAATGGTYRIKSFQVQTADYKPSADHQHLGEFVYPTIKNRKPVTEGKEGLILTPEDLTTNDQVFEFVNTGKFYTRTVTVTDPDTGATSEEVKTHIIFNVKSVVTGKGVLELNAATGISQIMRFRGNDDAGAGDLGRFFVQEMVGVVDADSGDIEPTFYLISSVIIQDGITPNRRFHQDLGMGSLNYNGFSGRKLDRWFIESAAVLSNSSFENTLVTISNPIKNELNINSDSKINTVKVYNVLGRQVLQKSFSGVAKASLNTSGLAAGLYLVKVSGDNLSYSKKIIKE